MAICESLAYIYSGAYGDIEQLGLINALLIMFQLTFAGIIVTLLDEMLSKGYGLGSGISLFIATNIIENIIWKSFSPIIIKTDSGTEFEGAFVNLVHLLFTKNNVQNALYSAFFRQSAPNMNNLIATLFIVLVVIYLQGFKVDIALSSQKIRGFVNQFAIKLFYTSNIPMIIQSSLVQNVYFLSQILYKRYRVYLSSLVKHHCLTARSLDWKWDGKWTVIPHCRTSLLHQSAQGFPRLLQRPFPFRFLHSLRGILSFKSASPAASLQNTGSSFPERGPKTSPRNSRTKRSKSRV